MATIELILQASADGGFRAVAECRFAGQDLPVRRQIAFALDREALAVAPTVEEYGAMLGRAVFAGELRDLFASALGRNGEQLRLLLQLDAPELRELRWERLSVPVDGAWRPLALEQRVLAAQF